MQHVPAFALVRVAAQLGVAGDAPDVAGDVVLLGQNLLRPQRFAQDRAAAEQLHLRRFAAGVLRRELVHAADDAFFDALRASRACS